MGGKMKCKYCQYDYSIEKKKAIFGEQYWVEQYCSEECCTKHNIEKLREETKETQLKCKDCKFYDTTYGGYCNNPKIVDNLLIMSYCDNVEFLPDFGCIYAEPKLKEK